MIKVFFVKGSPVIVNADDYERIVRHRRWGLNAGYVVTRGRNPIRLHHCILPPEGGLLVDHRNGNILDNRRSNLRLATKKQNARNARKYRVAKSRFKGVTPDPKTGRYRARVRCDDKLISLGFYQNEEDAARAYDSAALTLFGEFARTNFRDAAPRSIEDIRTEAKSRSRSEFYSKSSGVCRISGSTKWRAHIVVNGKHKHLGCFETFEEARQARLRFEKDIGKDLLPERR